MQALSGSERPFGSGAQIISISLKGPIYLVSVKLENTASKLTNITNTDTVRTRLHVLVVIEPAPRIALSEQRLEMCP